MWCTFSTSSCYKQKYHSTHPSSKRVRKSWAIHGVNKAPETFPAGIFSPEDRVREHLLSWRGQMISTFRLGGMRASPTPTNSTKSHWYVQQSFATTITLYTPSLAAMSNSFAMWTGSWELLNASRPRGNLQQAFESSLIPCFKCLRKAPRSFDFPIAKLRHHGPGIKDHGIVCETIPSLPVPTCLI